MKYLALVFTLLCLSGCAAAVLPLAPVVGEVAGAAFGQHPGYTTQAYKDACELSGGEWKGAPGAACEGNLLAAIFGEED